VCERLRVEPTATVFLDDLGANLKPARELGITTIKVGDPEAALAELQAVLGFELTD
jgi:putative hydrolase of the HAD superfamily